MGIVVGPHQIVAGPIAEDPARWPIVEVCVRKRLRRDHLLPFMEVGWQDIRRLNKAVLGSEVREFSSLS
jgi:hypothetical protein